MESIAINAIRGAVEAAFGEHAADIPHSYSVDPLTYEAGTTYLTVFIRDVSSLRVGSASATTSLYHDKGVLEITIFTPRSEWDLNVRTILDNIKNDLQNTRVAPAFIGNASSQDVPFDTDDAELAILCAFEIESYNKK